MKRSLIIFFLLLAAVTAFCKADNAYLQEPDAKVQDVWMHYKNCMADLKEPGLSAANAWNQVFKEKDNQKALALLDESIAGFNTIAFTMSKYQAKLYILDVFSENKLADILKPYYEAEISLYRELISYAKYLKQNGNNPEVHKNYNTSIQTKMQAEAGKKKALNEEVEAYMKRNNVQ